MQLLRSFKTEQKKGLNAPCLKGRPFILFNTSSSFISFQQFVLQVEGAEFPLGKLDLKDLLQIK
jgi:hypothetical protein